MPLENTPLGQVKTLPFPGRIIKNGDSDKETVRRVQQRLNAVGCGPINEDGVFDKKGTERAVKLFQARFADVTGSPLVIDGRIGALTWGAMFGASTIPANLAAPSELTKAAVAVATSQLGVMEQPIGSNRGPEVDSYLRAVGLDPTRGSFPWCVAFTYFCYDKAAANVSRKNPHIRTAGVLDHWNKVRNKAPIVRVTGAEAAANPALVKPGSLFIIDFGKGAGHTGMVIEVANGRLVTIEGNTNDNGTREGIGVFRRQSRKIAQINKGFIDYSAC